MPEVFYDMELEDFLLMQKGFFNKRKDDSLQFAKVGFYIAAIHQNGLAGKTLNSKTFFAEWFGEAAKTISKEDLKERSARIMEMVKHTNKILAEKEKNKKSAKRIKNSN